MDKTLKTIRKNKRRRVEVFSTYAQPKGAYCSFPMRRRLREEYAMLFIPSPHRINSIAYKGRLRELALVCGALLRIGKQLAEPSPSTLLKSSILTATKPL